MYGHKWVSNYGEEDDGTWQSGLRGVTPEQIGRGLAACLERVDVWPPSLPEFRQMCLYAPPSYHLDRPRQIEDKSQHPPEFLRAISAFQAYRERTGRIDPHVFSAMLEEEKAKSKALADKESEAAGRK